MHRVTSDRVGPQIETFGIARVCSKARNVAGTKENLTKGHHFDFLQTLWRKNDLLHQKARGIGFRILWRGRDWQHAPLKRGRPNFRKHRPRASVPEEPRNPRLGLFSLKIVEIPP